MTYADRREVVPFINTIDGFEYRLSSLAFRMIQQERKRVTFSRGHGEKTTDGELQTLAFILSQQYEVTDIEPVEGGTIDLSSVDVLIIAGPTQRISDEVRASVASYLDGVNIRVYGRCGDWRGHLSFEYRHGLKRIRIVTIFKKLQSSFREQRVSQGIVLLVRNSYVLFLSDAH